jgi:hypothetical protein
MMGVVNETLEDVIMDFKAQILCFFWRIHFMWKSLKKPDVTH